MPTTGLDPAVDRLTAALKAVRSAHTLGFANTVVSVGLIVLVGYLALQVKTVLHLTEIDPDGKVLFTGAPGSYTLSDLQVHHTLQEWIVACRWRTTLDPVVMQRFQQTCEALTDKQAAREIKTYFARLAEETKRTRANPVNVQLDHFRRGKEGPLYRQWWTETWTPRYGGAPKTIPMSALLTVELRSSYGLFGPMLTVGDENRSPTGIFVVEVHWIAEEEAL